VRNHSLAAWAMARITLIQGDQKVTQPIPDTCSICEKNKLNRNEETKKQCYIKCWKCPPRSAMHTFTLFLMSDATRWRVSAVTGNGSPDEISSICLEQENREMYPLTNSGKLSKNEMPSSVRQWTLVAFVKKDILALRLLKDNWRTGASRLQHDVTCMGSCIVTAILCMY
jgi:hypothetical protein